MLAFIATMDVEEQIYACAGLLVGGFLVNGEPGRKRRCTWTEDWLLRRENYGSYYTLHREFRLQEKLFNKYLRIPIPIYDYILDKITPLIMKDDLHMRQTIPPGARFEATLLYLINGDYYSRLQHLTRIHETTLGRFIPEVCEAIYSALGREFIALPSTPEQWLQVAKDFEIRWNFLHCIGAVDGKHIEIAPPPESGSYYYNYKGKTSVVLLAVINSNYEIMYADVGGNGRISDGGIWGNCSLRRLIDEGRAGLPEDSILPNSTRKLPFVFVGDEAFPLRRHFMKPYPHRRQNHQQRIFSYRLSRARRISENAFGIMAQRFGILRKAINLAPAKVEKIILAIITLHNLLRKLGSNEYLSAASVDSEDLENGIIEEAAWRSTPQLLPLQQQRFGNATLDAKQVREQFTEYFINEGQTSFQRRMAGLE